MAYVSAQLALFVLAVPIAGALIVIGLAYLTLATAIDPVPEYEAEVVIVETSDAVEICIW